MFDKYKKINFEIEKNNNYGFFKNEGNVKVALVSYKTLKKNFIKKIISNPDQEQIKAEKILTDLNHKNIVKCYKIYKYPKKIVIYMEYLNKGTLKNIIEQIHSEKNKNNYNKSKLTLMSGIIVYEILNGLSYLERKKIFHRDIKPSNICLNESGEIKITDFGISAQINETYESLHTLTGTQLFLAPEMLLDLSYLGKKTDIWALGILIYIFVFGKHPFLDVFDNFNLSSHVNCYYKLRKDNFRLSFEGGYKDFNNFLQSMLEFDAKKRKGIDELLNSSFLKKRIEGNNYVKNEFIAFLANFKNQKTNLFHF